MLRVERRFPGGYPATNQPTLSYSKAAQCNPLATCIPDVLAIALQNHSFRWLCPQKNRYKYLDSRFTIETCQRILDVRNVPAQIHVAGPSQALCVSVIRP